MKTSEALFLMWLGMLYVELGFSTEYGGLAVMAMTLLGALRAKVRGD